MTGSDWPERPAARGRWIGSLAGYLIYIVVALRKLDHLSESEALPAATALLAASLILFASLPSISQRFPGYRRMYFPLQVLLIQGLGLLPPFEDMWGVLYLPLSLHVWRELPRREALAWSGITAALLTVTMVSLFGPLEGLGFSLNIFAGGLFLVSYDLLHSQVESAQADSHRLLGELQQAHARLRDYTAQADELAAAQERERLMRELHDSVSQVIFSITLTAEATRILLAKNPERVPEQLEWLQALTGSALGQMRALISQWRPG